MLYSGGTFSVSDVEAIGVDAADASALVAGLQAG
jgi:hypothetical protein